MDKNAQLNDSWDQVEQPFDSDPAYNSADVEIDDAADADVDSNDETVVLEMKKPGGGKEIIEFMLPPQLLSLVPGAPDDVETIEIDDDEEIEVEEGKDGEDVEVEQDPWDWKQAGGPGRFVEWVMHMLNHMPGHSGYDSLGIERAISFLQRLEKEFSKAMRDDFKNEIDVAKAEKLRDGVLEGIEKLIDRLEKVERTKPGAKRKSKKKGPKSASWAAEYGLVKEAKSTNITGITITVPLLISSLARVCINSMVSAGHDLEDEYAKQVKEYNLDKQQQRELVQLLEDMGYALRIDRGVPVGTKVDPTRSDNSDWAANYPG